MVPYFFLCSLSTSPSCLKPDWLCSSTTRWCMLSIFARKWPLSGFRTNWTPTLSGLRNGRSPLKGQEHSYILLQTWMIAFQIIYTQYSSDFVSRCFSFFVLPISSGEDTPSKYPAKLLVDCNYSDNLGKLTVTTYVAPIFIYAINHSVGA